MGAPRVTTAEFEEMHRLYDELGSYKAVAEKMGRSPSTVARHVKMEKCPAVVRHTTKKLIRKSR